MIKRIMIGVMMVAMLGLVSCGNGTEEVQDNSGGEVAQPSIASPSLENGARFAAVLGMFISDDELSENFISKASATGRCIPVVSMLKRSADVTKSGNNWTCMEEEDDIYLCTYRYDSPYGGRIEGEEHVEVNEVSDSENYVTENLQFMFEEFYTGPVCGTEIMIGGSFVCRYDGQNRGNRNGYKMQKNGTCSTIDNMIELDVGSLHHDVSFDLTISYYRRGEGIVETEGNEVYGTITIDGNEYSYEYLRGMLSNVCE